VEDLLEVGLVHTADSDKQARAVSRAEWQYLHTSSGRLGYELVRINLH